MLFREAGQVGDSGLFRLVKVEADTSFLHCAYSMLQGLLQEKSIRFHPRSIPIHGLPPERGTLNY